MTHILLYCMHIEQHMYNLTASRDTNSLSSFTHDRLLYHYAGFQQCLLHILTFTRLSCLPDLHFSSFYTLFCVVPLLIILLGVSYLSMTTRVLLHLFLGLSSCCACSALLINIFLAFLPTQYSQIKANNAVNRPKHRIGHARKVSSK